MGLKIPPYRIDQVSNIDPGFYSTMGPFLSRREVVAELGAPVWDDDNKEWLIARTDEDVFGFLSMQANWVRSFYVVPDARQEAIGAALITRVLDLRPNQPVKVTATEASSRLFALYGFVETGTRGAYTTMERTASPSGCVLTSGCPADNHFESCPRAS